MAATILSIFRWLTSKIFRHVETGKGAHQDFARSDSGSTGKKGTRRRNRKKARQAEAKNNPPARQTSVHDLPDELLDRVLHGLAPSSLHLVRAAATCRRWRRAVAAGGFLARCRAIHGAPPAAGHYYARPAGRKDDRGRPIPALKLLMFVPTAARVRERRLFSLDFIYRPMKPKEGVVMARKYQWVSLTRQRSVNMEIAGSRGSLLLLQTAGARWSADFIVCEPVTRRFQGITFPAALGNPLFLGAFLLDGGGGGADAMSDYRVLSVLCERNERHWERGTPRACVFVPGADDGGWRLGWHTMDDDVEVRPVEKIHLAGRAARRIYWGIETGSVLVLDESTLKFSVFTFPEHMRWQYRRTSFRVIGGVSDGCTVRVVRMDGEELAIYGQMPGTGEWVVEKSVRLREAAAGLPGWKDSFLVLPARIVTAGENFVVLSPAEETWLFSVELETMELEREHERNWHDGPAYPCALPWPPVIQACVDQSDFVGKGRRRRKR